MYRILSTSRTGLKAMEVKVNSIADDLANVNTYGYKKKEIGFQELMTNEIHENDVLKSANVGHSRVNVGAKSGLATVNFKQGALMESNSSFNMAIEGSGFFGIYDGEGNFALTRNGGFQRDRDNNIVDDRGNRLAYEAYITIEEWGEGDISISSTGEISQMLGDEVRNLGRVILYNPEVLDSLTSLGEGKYLPSANLVLYNSLDNPEGFGKLIQNYLEGSNVDMGKSMADLIVTQRAYSVNAKAVQSTDDVMSMVNGIKK